MSGIYNETFFKNHPVEAEGPGVLYCVILVNKKTLERECIKIGIAYGKNWKDVLRRSRGFTGYEIRIQKVVHSTLYKCWKLEQQLHEQFKHLKFSPTSKFGGYTECFQIDNDIIRSVPKNI